MQPPLIDSAITGSSKKDYIQCLDSIVKLSIHDAVNLSVFAAMFIHCII